YWPRGRTLGGSSSINAQMYLRGHELDYARWEQLGNPGWGFEDVLPYFQKLERYPRGASPLHGVRGPVRIEGLRDPNPSTLAFLPAAGEVGIATNDDPNGATQEGASPSPVTQRRGRRWSAADAYLRPALRRANLAVITGAQATRILLEGRRATGIAFRRGDAIETACAGREVILAAGAIKSPQILLLSGIGPAEHLRELGIEVVHHLAGVGKNLLDHLAVAVIVACRTPNTLVSAESIGNLLRFLVFRRGMLTSNVAEAGAFVRTRPELDAPGPELVFAPVPFVDHGLVKPAGHGLTIGAVVLQPKSVGFLELSSPDPRERPRIQPNYLSDKGGEDLRVLVDGVKLGRRIFQASAFAAYAGEEIEPGTAAR